MSSNPKLPARYRKLLEDGYGDPCVRSLWGSYFGAGPRTTALFERIQNLGERGSAAHVTQRSGLPAICSAILILTIGLLWKAHRKRASGVELNPLSLDPRAQEAQEIFDEHCTITAVQTHRHRGGFRDPGSLERVPQTTGQRQGERSRLRGHDWLLPAERK